MPSRSTCTTRWRFHLSGRACLDLANTVSWRRGGQPIERLNDYGDLLEWARQSRALTAAEVLDLERAARRRPAAAAQVLRRARELRETLYRIFSGIAAGAQPAREDLARLDAELHEALSALHLTWTRSKAALAWSDAADELARPLWTAARSAADVLASSTLGRMKTCPGSSCGWVFLDTSKSGTRRWCDMRVCGSRDKAQRYYARVTGSRRGRMRSSRRPA